MSARTQDGWSVSAKYRNGEIVHVRWPDGTESEHKVVVREFSETANDMGHSYEMSNSVSGIMVDFHGQKQWISLDDVEVLPEGTLTEIKK